jgi:hypothetical protein
MTVRRLPGEKRLFIIECMPKSDGCKEGELLFNLLGMTIDVRSRGEVALKDDLVSKPEFLKYVARKSIARRFDFIHLSGHGDPDGCRFEVPRGKVRPEEFPEDCFKGRTVTFASCGLSRNGFMQGFLNRTGAEAAIAPLNDVDFDDSAIWYSYFYYLVLHHGFTPWEAFERTRRFLCDSPRNGRVKGGFQYWALSN